MMKVAPAVPLSGYLPTLDGWRAIAILAVVLFNHDHVHRLGKHTLSILHEDGGYGVDVFFAISGLLICARLLEEERMDGSISLKRFYIRRFFRIQPAAWIYVAVIGLLMGFGALVWAPKDLLGAALMVRNYFPLHRSPHFWYTAHFWSLAVEEHFYLFLPGFLVLFRRHRVAILLSVLMLLEVWRIIVLEHKNLQFGWYWESRTDIAVWGILLAAWLALVMQKSTARTLAQRWLQPWVVVLVVLVVRLFVYRHDWELTAFALRCSFSFLVLSTVLHPGTILGRILEMRALRFIGRISYSLYLWQMLFFPFYAEVLPPRWALLAAIQNSGWRYLAVPVMALMSYYLVEKPMIRLGHRLAKSRIPGPGEFMVEIGKPTLA